MPKTMNLPLVAFGFANLPRVLQFTTPAPLPPSTWADVITSVTGYFTPTQIVAVLASVVAAGIVFVMLWWGVRLAFRSIMGAVKNGTLSINGGRRRRR